jgi:hypothetical protein
MDVEKLARAAGYEVEGGEITMPYLHPGNPADEAAFLARFADLVLEEAAKVARAQRLGMPGHAGPGPCPILYKGSVEDAIRALKTP